MLPALNSVEAQTEHADRTAKSGAFIHRSYPLPSAASLRYRSNQDLSTNDVATKYHLWIAKSGATRLSRTIISIIPSSRKRTLLPCFPASAASRAQTTSPAPATRCIGHRAASTNAITRLSRALLEYIGLRCCEPVVVTGARGKIAW